MLKFNLNIIYLFLILCICMICVDCKTYYFGNSLQFSLNINEKNDYMILSHNDILKYLFNIIDQNNDEFLDYREMAVYQYYTEPSIKLTYQLFVQICQLLDEYSILSMPVGLDMNMFNASYTIYSEELGTDIYKDFIKILKIMRAM